MEPRYVQLAGVSGAVVFLAIAAFQTAPAAGLPLGAAAWGGVHHGVLPRNLRIGSAVAVLIWLLAAVMLLERVRVLSLGLDPTFTRVALWAVTALLALGTIMNAVSRSKTERLVWTPTAATALVLCLFVALYA